MTSPVHVRACSGCGASLVHRVTACKDCGTPAESAHRRMVTLLFADLVGYTALCESRDPEQVHLLIRPLMNALRRLCEERGGIVPGIQGDGFMAVFGARAAQEDDPTRALEAAVQLQRAVEARRAVLPELPGLRVGLHMGEVLVAASWEDTGISVSGDAVNVASRVSSEAAPGEVLVTAPAVDLARAEMGWSEERELRLRGREATVCARTFDWSLVPEVVRGPRWSASSPYVSREHLEAAVLTALDSGPGVLLVGDAGMGKTRLVKHVLQGRSVLHAAASTAMRPSVLALFGELFGQLPESPAELLRLLRGGSSDGLSDEDLLLRSAAERLGATAPPGTVITIEDAELLPESEVAVLASALRSSGLPSVVVSRIPRPDLGLTDVRVTAWSSEEASVLLEKMLPRASGELRRAVLTRAGDCPLYVEQCAQLLLDNGAVAVDEQGTHVRDPARLVEIPTSMRLFVSSRLDLLPEAERDVLGTAAVLGPEPDLALLRHLVGDQASSVENLVERGFLRWASGTSGQPELRFSHALVRDVAYETQLKSRRVQIHRAAAEWYAVLPVAQVLESQAYHLESAVQLEEAGCDLVQRAVEAMVLYARSIEQERTRISREVLVRAREMAERRPECVQDTLLLELAWAAVTELAGDAASTRDAAGRALLLAAERQDERAIAEAHLLLARSFRFDDAGQAAEHLSEAAAGYLAVSDPAGIARVEIEQGILAGRQTGLAAYLSHLERAYQQAMRSADVRLQATCAQLLALHHALTNGRDPFAVWAGLARDVSRSDDVGLEPRLDVAAAALAVLDLNPSDGLEPAQRALGAGRDLGLAHVYSNALIATVDLLLLSGRLQEAAVLLAEARRYAATLPTSWLTLQLDLLEARLRQREGRPSAAVGLLEVVAEHELSGQQVMRRDLAEARAWAALERGKFGEARALAAEAVTVDEEMAERCTPMRPRLVELVATVVGGETPSLGTIATLRAQSRETGLGMITQLAMRWMYVDELTRGWTVDLHGLEPCRVIECRALDLEIEALSSRRWELLLDAAAVWAELGITVWQARALVWHSELTGTASPEADQLLTTLQSPVGLGETLRAQVRGLRA